MLKFIFSLFFVLLASSAVIADGPADNVLFWTELHLSLMGETGPFIPPPLIGRSIAIVQTCIYDAWSIYDSVAVSVYKNGVSKRTATNDADIDTSISYAAFRCMEHIFGNPNQATQLQKLKDAFASAGGDESMTSTDDSTPEGVGNAVAAAILAFRMHDGANSEGDEPGTKNGAKYSDYSNYAPANPPQPQVGLTGNCSAINLNRWQPLRVQKADGTIFTQSWVCGHCSLVTPFSVQTSMHLVHLMPGPPLKGSNNDADYVSQFTEVLEFSTNLDDTGKMIAEYWADGPATPNPPGHWTRITAAAAQAEGLGRGDTAKLLFLQGQAVMDAGLAAWTIKRIWDSIRPITAIQCLFEGQTVQAWRGPYQGVGSIKGETWQPYQEIDFITPPFAAYVSGHSAFSAASAEILRRWFGDDQYRGPNSITFQPGSSLFEPKKVSGETGFISGVTDVPNSGKNTVGYSPANPVTLTWNTWTEAAQEAGISRIHGGIHIQSDNIDGQTLGTNVGRKVWTAARGFFNGNTRRQWGPNADSRANFVDL